MGDLKPILDAISNDAKMRQTAIYDEAKRRIKLMNAEFDKEKEHFRKSFEDDLDREIDKIYERGRAQDNQMIKDAKVRAKADFIKEVISGVKKQIADDNNYSAFLSALYKNCTDTQDGTIYLNEKDKKRIKKGTFGKAKIADESILVSGGFVAEFNDLSYDFTLESIFEEKFSEICNKINEICGKERQ